MKVKPKLYLNMSPQTQEEGTLAFAKNMKVDDDGSLISDYGYEEIISDITTITGDEHSEIIGHIVGLDNNVYFFTNTDEIVKWNEISKTSTVYPNCWEWNRGTISGFVSTNQSGETILTVAESGADNDVPLKHINLSYPNASNKSLYCQAPVVPITNLIFNTTYSKTIPNGVYVFFIRYKIRKDVYTPWYLCSRPVFAGTSEKTNTLQGGLKYINTHKDSSKSFVFDVEHINTAATDYYKEFQIGFIITHDDATDARIWKSFDITTTVIYFDYENIQDANIDDLLATTYELYNVRNVTSFKNKLYISNYKETDFNVNEDLDNITIGYKQTNGSSISYRQVTFNGITLYYEPQYRQFSSQPGLDLGQDFDYSFSVSLSNLAKGDVRESSDILTFDARWVNREAGNDRCIIYGIQNKLLYGKLFGESYDVSWSEALASVQAVSLEDINYYTDYKGTDVNLNHSWVSENLTFMYGNLPTGEVQIYVNPRDCKNSVFYFNKTSLVYKRTGSDTNCWIAKGGGFDKLQRETIDTNIKAEIRGKSFFAIAYIEVSLGGNIYRINPITDNMSNFLSRIDKENYAGYEYLQNNVTKNELHILDNDYFTTGNISGALKNAVKEYVYPYLLHTFAGFTYDVTPIFNMSDEQSELLRVPLSAVNVVFKKFDFSIESDELENSDDEYHVRYKVSLKTTDYVSYLSFAPRQSRYTLSSETDISQKATLLPFTKYKAYIHFVDEHNIITNGIYKNDINIAQITNFGPATVFDLTYNVTNIPSTLTNKYKAFFISIVNVGDIVIECFGYTKDSTGNHIVSCLELDALLYNLNDKITLWNVADNTTQGRITTTAKYYPSGASNPIMAFGNCGYITWSDNTDSYKNVHIVAIISRSNDNTSETNQRLIKATPYIPLTATTTTTVRDGFYNSYLCGVKKPDFELASRCYVAGNDIYSIDRDVSLELKEFKSYVAVQDSDTYYIRSNFNLNYLTLTKDIEDKIFTIGNASSGVKQVAKVLDSLILSSIYELKGMYKDFMNKYFIQYDANNTTKTQFDNTIRLSNVLSDETFNNSVFTFKATDYYNVPTDRGIIVKLFNIGNNIYVHTKASFYKFDGNSTIVANNTDIQLQESEPFSNGITQIFDSEYGYGGINNKEAGCVTFDSYFFYDQISKHIFAYNGNGQVSVIDNSIYKFLIIYNLTSCRTLHDEANHRVLFDFYTDKVTGTNINHRVTLSYNYRLKSFVSLHDIDLLDSFSTNLACYSYHNHDYRLYKLFDTTNDINSNNLFGNATVVNPVNFQLPSKSTERMMFEAAVVLYPRQYARENVEFISIDADVIQNYINGNDIYIQQHIRTNPINKMYIATDCCTSIQVFGTVNDEARPESLLEEPPIPNSLTDYKGFKYDGGSWNANYFRSATNSTNVYNYSDQPRSNKVPNTDNYSLVYGKYFIIDLRFIEDNSIKLENIYINSNKY